MRINRLSLVMPALLMSTSIESNISNTSATSCCAASKSAAFDLKAFAVMPNALSSASNSLAGPSEELYVKATLAPCLANAMAMPRPMPLLAPVMMMFFPFTKSMILC